MAVVSPISRTAIATYADVLAAPSDKIAEVVDGALYITPRPTGSHVAVASILGEELGPPFRRGRGGPGGWLILDTPEIHLGHDIVVADLAGWRRPRAPSVDRAFFTVAPDWICEVLSPSTEKFDRSRKLGVYARAGVGHAWLLNPQTRTLEVLRRLDVGWLTVCAHIDDALIRAEPFDAVELELGALWAELPPADATP